MKIKIINYSITISSRLEMEFFSDSKSSDSKWQPPKEIVQWLQIMQKVSILKRILKMLRKKLNGTGICGFATLRLSVSINGLVGY